MATIIKGKMKITYLMGGRLIHKFDLYTSKYGKSYTISTVVRNKK